MINLVCEKLLFGYLNLMGPKLELLTQTLLTFWQNIQVKNPINGKIANFYERDAFLAFLVYLLV